MERQIGVGDRCGGRCGRCGRCGFAGVDNLTVIGYPKTGPVESRKEDVCHLD